MPAHYIRPVASLSRVWVHVTRLGRIKRLKYHAPVVELRRHRPRPVPGCVELEVSERRLLGVHVMQSSPDLLLELFVARLKIGDVIQVEGFVVGRRASRSSTASPGGTTRDLIGQIIQAVGSAGLAPERAHLCSSAAVKPWATDERLERAGLVEAIKGGMRHARDAARHALFVAVRAGAPPDPLSKE